MKVSLKKNPKAKGFSVSFPYEPSHVTLVKQCLGLSWNKNDRTWDSLGPEILLDFQRFGIEISHMTDEARVIAEEFRQQIWDSMDCRSLDLNAELYGYQKQGTKYLAGISSAVLGDQMGTGKSKQALDAAFLIAVEKENAYRRIPEKPRDDGTSVNKFSEGALSRSTGEENKESDSESQGRKLAINGFRENERSHTPTRSSSKTLGIFAQPHQSELVQFEREADEPVHFEDGEYIVTERLPKRAHDKNEGSQYGSAQSAVPLQSGFCPSTENDSDRIRQQDYSSDRNETKRREKIYGARGFRLESVQDKTFRILILVPKTLTYNWADEVQKWYPEISFGVVPDNSKTTRSRKGEVRLGRDHFWKNLPVIVIANYDKLETTDWPYEIFWDAVIADEASALKNSKTRRWKNVKRVTRKAGRVWPLTGTPMEKKVEDIYNIFLLIRPAVLGTSFYRFQEQHLQTDWAGNVTGVKNLNLLRERIAPFMLRRTKEELRTQLQIPGKLPPNNVFVEFTQPEKEAYFAFTSEFNNWLDEHGVSGAGNAMTEMLRMEQFCCTPALFTEDLGKGSKFKKLVEVIEEWEGQIVVFCFYEEVVALLQRWLNLPPDALISGKVASELRIPRIKAFNEGKLGKVLLSTDAGKFGLNITSANLIIHYQQLWNPMMMEQREDRLDRIGQTSVVNVINLMCLDTIDYGKYQNNQIEKQLFEEVIEGSEEIMMRRLNPARLRAIAEGRLVH